MVNEHEAEHFSNVFEDESDVIQSSRTAAFSIIAIAFKEDNKWRLSDGTGTISAKIADIEFLRRINANQVSFSKGDTLICDISTTQIIGPEKIATTHIVERVVEHRPAPKQLDLNLESGVALDDS